MSAPTSRRRAVTRRSPVSRRVLLAAAAATAAVTALPPRPARAADRYWVDTSNNWTANFWAVAQNGSAGASIPGNGDNAYVLFNDAVNRTVTYDSTTPINSAGYLYLDNTGKATSTLSQSQGGLGFNQEFVGHDGNGAFTLNGGTNTVGLLHLGYTAGSRGTYTLGGTGVLNSTTEFVGFWGQGTFTQPAGTNTVSNTLALAYAFNGTNAASSGTYNLSGGTLSVGNATGGQLVVGYTGSGTFNHTGNAAVTTFDLILGRNNNGGGTNAAAAGSYSMSNTASLTIRNTLVVGDSGSGTFTQNGGTVTFTNTNAGSVLTLGAGATGAYTLNSGSITIGGFAAEEVGSFGTGTFTQNGGTNTADILNVAHYANGTNPASGGTYTLNGGTLTTNQEVLGYAGTATFNQTNGAHLTAFLTLGQNPALSGGPASSGTLNLAGGTLTVNRDLRAADGGAATINQTGGTLNVNGWLYLGHGYGTPSANPAGYANYTLAAGTLNAPQQSVGYAGTNTSTFTQTGGSNNAASFITVGDQPGNRGIYNLQDGALNAYNTNVAWSGNGTVNQIGGAHTTNSLYLGHEAGSSGTYNLSAGTLTVGGVDQTDDVLSTFVGYSGTGAFFQSGGTHAIVAGNFNGLYVGYNVGSAGSYHLDNGTLDVSQPYAETYVGYQGTGTFIQNGGAHIAYQLTTGYLKPGVGTYTLNNGTLNVQYEYAGWFGDGTFNQNSGTHSAVGLTLGYAMNSPAAGGPATGTFNLAGGTFTVTTYERIAIDGTGAFNQTAGQHTVGAAGSNNGSVTLGYDVTGVGTYALAGGILTVNGTETVGRAGSGTFTQTGGTHTVTGSLTIAALAGSTGAYHLAAGTLTAPVVNNGQFDLGAATYAGNFTNNATLNVTANGSTFSGTLTTSAPSTTNVNFPLTVSSGISNAGSIFLPSAVSLTVNGSGLNNNGGNINLSGGTLGGSGPITSSGYLFGYGTLNGAGALTNNGTITQDSGNLTFAKTDGATNNNQITLAPGRQLVLASPLTNNATLDLGGGTGATVSGPAALVNAAAGSIVGPGTITAPFTNAGTLLLPAGTLSLQQPVTSSGAIQLNAFTSHLVGGSLTNTGTIQGLGVVSNPLTNNGTIEAIGGTLSLTGPLTNNSAGILRAAAGAKLLVTTGLATNSGVVNLAGGTFDNNGLPLTNTGQLSGFGTFATGGLTNNGAVFLTGGNSTVNGPVTNSAGSKISVRYNPALFTGPVTNAGTLEVLGTTATFAAGGPLPAPLPADTSSPAAAAAPLPGGALDGPGTTTLASAASLIADHVRQSALTLTGNSTLTLRPGATPLAPQGTSVVTQLSLDATSTIDLANNALIIDYTPGSSPIADLHTYVARAYSAGTWHGPGLTSSLIPATPAGAIGYAESAPLLGPAGGTFAGQTADPSSLLVRLTLAGDASLDGHVNFTDLLALAKNYNRTGAHWYQGDFNYDGTVNFTDLLTLARNYNAALPSDPLPGAPADFSADLAAAFATVPEPSTALTMTAACGFALSARRRRSFRP